MDRISFECAKNVSTNLTKYVLKYGENIKVWKYPKKANHIQPYLKDIHCTDDPLQIYTDTWIAPTIEDMQKILASLHPSEKICLQFKQIENIDEFAYKLSSLIKSFDERQFN